MLRGGIVFLKFNTSQVRNRCSDGVDVRNFELNFADEWIPPNSDVRFRITFKMLLLILMWNGLNVFQSVFS